VHTSYHAFCPFMKPLQTRHDAAPLPLLLAQDTEMWGAMDPYAVVSMTSDPQRCHRATTTRMKAGTEPHWDETVHFDLGQCSGDELLVQLYNQNRCGCLQAMQGWAHPRASHRRSAHLHTRTMRVLPAGALACRAAPDDLIGQSKVSLDSVLASCHQEVRLPLTSHPSGKQEGYVDIVLNVCGHEPEQATDLGELEQRCHSRQ
jgi:hypothetical protein